MTGPPRVNPYFAAPALTKLLVNFGDTIAQAILRLPMVAACKPHVAA